MMNHYDVIVIGAGGMGSAAAYHLAKDGRRVLLLEQFHLGHTRGSSHGGSRITRYTHPHVDDARVIPATYELWRTLEAESGATLLKMTGGLYFAPADDPFMIDSQRALNTFNFPYRLLSQTEQQVEFPQFQLPKDWIALYQADSGILAASACVAALAKGAVAYGATLREETPVRSVTPQGDGVVVTTAGGETFSAQQAIIAAGPWASTFLRPLLEWSIPLQVTHQQVAYFRVENEALYAADRCPVYIFAAEPHCYGFPIWEKPGHIKVALEMHNSTTDPDQPRPADAANIAALSAIIAQHFQGVDPTPQQVDTCLYTETANRDFVIDRHPDHPQILFAAGFSGRGFKFTIGIGRLLADLAAGAPGNYNSHFWMERYAIKRFAPQSVV